MKFFKLDSDGNIEHPTIWFFLSIFVPIISIILFFSFSVKVLPAEVAISVDLYGEDKGVEVEVLPTGRNFFNSITHDVIKYPAYVQNHKFEDVNFKDSDGLSLSTDITVDYKFKAGDIPTIYTTYRQSADNIKEMYFDKWLKDSVIRTVSGKYNAEKLYSAGMSEFKDDIVASLRERFEKEGIEVRDVYLDDLQLPEQVTKQIQEKINATQIAQRKERELQATEADVAKIVAEEEGKAKSRIIEAESRSKSNAIIQQSLTTQVIEFKRLENQIEAIRKWNGQLPQVTNGGDGLILDLGNFTK